MSRVVVICFPIVLLSAGVHAQVVIDTVPVGDTGNEGELSGAGAGGHGPDRICGAVDYIYNIGRFEVTAGHYAEFLNAVAAEDPYGLYNTNMANTTPEVGGYGCNIQRGGSPGSYYYSVASEWANRPVNYVSWSDAARFANWLHNGQLTGAQNLSTTEDGSYYLDGATSNAELMGVVRELDATWVIPSEDEWYKAAYYYGLRSVYYDYPTSSNHDPGYVNNVGNLSGTGTPFTEGGTDPGNYATYKGDGGMLGIGSPYYRTEVGEWENSDSYYGTSDQGGNVWEWNEAILSGSYRGLRGGVFTNNDYDLHAAYRYFSYPTTEYSGLGCRVARLPALGDFDADGAVDPSDYAEFPACLAGPGVGLAPQCGIFDFDFDGDVDLADVAGFQRVYRLPPGMVYVPAGEFEMGDPWSEGDDDERPVHTVYLSPYYIDAYEVTNQQYADALNWAYAQGGLITVINNAVYQYGSGTSYPYCDTTESSTYSRITWDGSIFGAVSGKEDHAMVRVNWYGAVAFCNWRSAMESKPLCYDLSTWTCDFGVAGYRLPTEAEWEKASAWDPVQERHFRFSEHSDGCGFNCLDGHRANFYSSGSPFALVEDPPWTTPVGFYNGELHYKADFGWPATRTSYQTQVAKSYFGCYDMSGNVSEWCNDWYDSVHYDSSPYSNPQGPDMGTVRVLRGGGWFSAGSDCRSTYRAGYSPGYRYYSYGFRCALGTP